MAAVAYVHAKSLQSCQTLLYLCAVARQAPLSMGFFSQEYWSGLPFPPSGGLPDPGIELASPASPALAGRFSATEPPGLTNKMSMCVREELLCSSQFLDKSFDLISSSLLVKLRIRLGLKIALGSPDTYVLIS